MSRELFDLWKRLPPGPKRWLRRRWYEAISALDTGQHLLFMNHGFAPADAADSLALSAADEPHRFAIQLYDRVADLAEWAGRDALEVGCGRGGGAAFLMRTRRPRSLVAVDLTDRAIRFCRRRHRLPGLRFERADAQALPFPDEQFDLVLNVESSVLYEDPARFFREVHRVLRPGGRFLFADSRRARKLATLRTQLAASGLAPLEEHDISKQVVHGLELSSGPRRELLTRVVPRPLRGLFRRFAHLEEDERERRLFEEGRKIYLVAALAKPLAGARKGEPS